MGGNWRGRCAERKSERNILGRPMGERAAFSDAAYASRGDIEELWGIKRKPRKNSEENSHPTAEKREKKSKDF